MSYLGKLHGEIRSCRICRDTPNNGSMPLPHAPNPVVVLSRRAKIAICGQAPGNKVNISGVPFTDPSGDRLREWMGVTSEQFYDKDIFAIVPMGFCFPGYDKNGSDLPPRRECRENWHERVFQLMPQLKIKLLIGASAQQYHLGNVARKTVSETVANWRWYSENFGCFPLPHPSWRNSGWIKRHPWFESQLLPDLRKCLTACGAI